MSQSTYSPMHNVRVSMEFLGDVKASLQHAIEYSDGGSEQNEEDLVNWRRAEIEVDALIAEIRAEEKIEKLSYALKALLLNKVESQSRAIAVLKEITNEIVVIGA
jgi:hypothetical protein